MKRLIRLQSGLYFSKVKEEQLDFQKNTDEINKNLNYNQSSVRLFRTVKLIDIKPYHRPAWILMEKK